MRERPARRKVRAGVSDQCGTRTIHRGRRISAFNSGVSSTRNIRFDVATEGCHFAGFALTQYALFRPPNELVEFCFAHSILLKRVVIGMNGHGTKRDDLVTVENADVLALGGTLEQRREIYPGLSR